MMRRQMLRMAGVLVATVALATSVTTGWAVDNLAAAGATFPYPLYSKWFDTYQKKAGVAISYQSIGSGGGIRQLKAKTVDIGASDAPLTNQEGREMGGEVLHLPTVAGAVAVIYNVPGVGKGLKLTPDVLADMYLGKVKRWNDKRITSLNPGEELPNLAVAVVHRSDGSGTTHIFTTYLTAVNRSWGVRVGAGKSVDWPTGIGGKGNEGVAAMVKQTSGAVGYAELAYATENKLPYAFLRNKAGKFIEPTLASTTAAAGAAKAMKKDVRVSIVNSPANNAYPIAGLTYLLVYRNQSDAERGRAVADFLWWAVHDGQKDASKLHYAPLPAEVVDINEAKIKAMSCGGKPLRSK